MRLKDWLSVPVWVVVLSFLFPTIASAETQVWSGLTKSFTKPGFADPDLLENQDRITANVALTRADTLGMYNALAEDFYGDFSPADTVWATDINNPGKTIAATNWENLDFDTWVNAYGGFGGPAGNVPGRDAVVYLITDDIFLDIRFSQWGVGRDGGGGSFSYLRAEGVPEPTTIGLLLAASLGLFGCCRRPPR